MELVHGRFSLLFLSRSTEPWQLSCYFLPICCHSFSGIERGWGIQLFFKIFCLASARVNWSTQPLECCQPAQTESQDIGWTNSMKVSENGKTKPKQFTINIIIIRRRLTTSSVYESVVSCYFSKLDNYLWRRMLRQYQIFYILSSISIIKSHFLIPLSIFNSSNHPIRYNF